MQTELHPDYRQTPDGKRAEQILRNCVHCGFCLATCPTYQLLGDERDSPRGRIYLIKQVLEGQAPGPATQLHLDRCLTCRNCESTCPSGVEYSALLDIGRRLVDQQVPRPPLRQALRWTLKEGLPSPLFGPAVRLANAVRPLLPQTLRAKLGPPRKAADSPAWPDRVHDRKVLLLAGCVQPGLQPNINPATARVLDAAGVQTLVATGAGCCGAIRAHMADRDGGLADMRRNIDAWLPYAEGTGGRPKVEAIIMNASGCGATVKEYAKYLADDPDYAQKARQVSALTRDAAEFVADLAPTLAGRLAQGAGTLAVHVPCTLQHGQKLPGTLEKLLTSLGFKVQVSSEEHHLCCGSAGTYSVLEPELATRLRDRKLAHLARLDAPVIVSANIGCIQHLQSGTERPVHHWIELVDQALEPTG